jgi:RNA recognition motif-containing protein
MGGRMPGSSGETLQGTLIPNKVFIGGLAEKTNERDLRDIFENLVDVKEVKIITDRSLTSKSGEPRRYAFVELENEKDVSGEMVANDVRRIVDHFAKKELELHGRRLNIGPAYKKVPTFGRIFGPGLPAPTFESSMETMYLQQLIAQQQRLIAQHSFPYGGYMQNYSTGQGFGMAGPAPGSASGYPSTNISAVPTMYGYPGPTPNSPSYQQSPVMMSPVAPQVYNMPDARYSTAAGNRQEQRTSNDRSLIRTSAGFTEVDSGMLRAQMQQYNGHH